MSGYSEDDLLPLSALQHLVFCERQCALIHIEQVWRDNTLTLEGTHLHHRTHETAPRTEMGEDLIITRGLSLRSFALGVSGKADVVEFHRVAQSDTFAAQGGLSLSGLAEVRQGVWTPFPVEYKRGKPKADRCDEVQLCAQAICLEEMGGSSVMKGALFYGSLRRRHVVCFTDDLRAETLAAARKLHEMIQSGITPRMRRMPKCRRCSLVEICRPDATGRERAASQYVAKIFADMTLGDEGWS
jgi:CRISPR-associated exonuclease Cas4